MDPPLFFSFKRKKKGGEDICEIFSWCGGILEEHLIFKEAEIDILMLYYNDNITFSKA